ncbi:MAG: hypothetical protein QE274_17255 [Verrucomicrobiaceae bacterium]|nr:hypothetical protein [Verrucomicrobiaceae bacterium]
MHYINVSFTASDLWLFDGVDFADCAGFGDSGDVGGLFECVSNSGLTQKETLKSFSVMLSLVSALGLVMPFAG